MAEMAAPSASPRSTIKLHETDLVNEDGMWHGIHVTVQGSRNVQEALDALVEHYGEERVYGSHRTADQFRWGFEAATDLAPRDTDPTHPLVQHCETGPASRQPDDWAAWLLGQIRIVVADGLPGGYYGDIDMFRADFWGGDVPWNDPLSTEVLSRVESHPTFAPLRAAFQGRFGVDIWEDDPQGREDAQATSGLPAWGGDRSDRVQQATAIKVCPVVAWRGEGDRKPNPATGSQGRGPGGHGGHTGARFKVTIECEATADDVAALEQHLFTQAEAGDLPVTIIDLYAEETQ